jgi:hypothetical protein
MPQSASSSIRVLSAAGALAILATGACKRDAPPPVPEAATMEAPAPSAVDDPAVPPASSRTTPASGARISVYTELDECPVLVDTPEEAGYRVQECEGPGGFKVRLVTADARDNLMIQAPGGEFLSLGLPELVNGAFGTVRPRVEWRGLERAAFVPDILVARYMVAEDPSNPTRETAYLVVARLTAPGPCVAARVSPSPTQSDEARELADSAPECKRARE